VVTWPGGERQQVDGVTVNTVQEVVEQVLTNRLRGETMNKAGTVFPALVLGLATAAGAALALDDWLPSRREERAEEFHRLVGGLGFGPALDLAGCEFGFDPRLCPACSGDCGPIAGGRFFCPHHASSTFDYAPLAPRREGVSRLDDVLP
jgi:hypothetical protein